MIDIRPIDSPMDPNQKLTTEEGELFSDLERYRRLVGKLIYLTITRSDLSFTVEVVSQFMQSPCVGHWNSIIHILRYVKKAPDKGCYMKIEEAFISLDIVMQIGHALLLTNNLLLDTVCSLDETLFHRKVRNIV